MVRSAVSPAPRSSSYLTNGTPSTSPEALNTCTPWRRPLIETLTADKVKADRLVTSSFCSNRLVRGLNCGVLADTGIQSLPVSVAQLVIRVHAPPITPPYAGASAALTEPRRAVAPLAP